MLRPCAAVGTALVVALASCASPNQKPSPARREIAPQAAPAAAHRSVPPLPSAEHETLRADGNLAAAPEPNPGLREAEPASYPFNALVPGREIMRTARATRLASLSPAQCKAELRSRGVGSKPPGKPAPGVAAPMRLDGPLHGVRYVTPGAKSVYGILDCRLALVLDELAVVLAQHGIVEVRVDNLYRPKAKLPGRRKPSQHSYGLAVDVYGFKLASGVELQVERDWHGLLGAPPCGPDGRVTETKDEAIALRNLVCEVARAGLFHHLLTPSYDEAHRNHVHFDIKRDSNELMVR